MRWQGREESRNVEDARGLSAGERWRSEVESAR